MYFIYTKKIPFFEQYRFNPKVLPNLRRILGLGKSIPKDGNHCFGPAWATPLSTSSSFSPSNCSWIPNSASKR